MKRRFRTCFDYLAAWIKRATETHYSVEFAAALVDAVIIIYDVCLYVRVLAR